MPKPAIAPRIRRSVLLVVAGLWGATPACGDDPARNGPGSAGGGPNAGGTAAGSGAATGGAVSGGVANGGTTSGSGGATGGSAATGGSGGTGGTGAAGGLMGTGGGLDPGDPVFEQDDPNLHPPDSAYQRVAIPAAVTNVMSIDIDWLDFNGDGVSR